MFLISRWATHSLIPVRHLWLSKGSGMRRRQSFPFGLTLLTETLWRGWTTYVQRCSVSWGLARHPVPGPPAAWSSAVLTWTSTSCWTELSCCLDKPLCHPSSPKTNSCLLERGPGSFFVSKGVQKLLAPFPPSSFPLTTPFGLVCVWMWQPWDGKD